MCYARISIGTGWPDSGGANGRPRGRRANDSGRGGGDLGGEVPALDVEGVGGEVEAKQDGGGAERAGETGGADGRPRGRRANHSRRGRGNPSGEVPALGIGGVGGEVEHV
ncbi:hypothetical protein E2562_024054 [Oryza meyeriana var. granulata]|uniref:Uncharacterized protein n=1 Tax=Oryza meyeriana var. granulata TaxID=110450 RepID=A0A6G1CU14_9ORYZ|nr:hypothetical protein E2562_024054 [Oryza meyeriana var. granulata]